MSGISTYVVGAYEHPVRRADGISSARLHADVVHGALAAAGLTIDDVDGYFCGADAPGLGPVSMAEYIGFRKLRYMDSTETGGSSYIVHVAHAMQAIAQGRCNVAVIALADRPLAAAGGTGLAGVDFTSMPGFPFMPPVPLPPV